MAKRRSNDPFGLFPGILSLMTVREVLLLVGDFKIPSTYAGSATWGLFSSSLSFFASCPSFLPSTSPIFGFRFLYGLRTVAPMVLGASRIPPFRFLLWNLLGAFTWTMTI